MVNNWLITGGCGFIGTALIKQLLGKNLAKNIRVLDNLTVGTKEDLATVCDFTEVDVSDLSPDFSTSSLSPQISTLSPKGNDIPIVELVVGDIRNPETCEQCCRNIDVIIHLAANTGVPVSVEKPRLDMECNVNGTFNMLEGARVYSVKRFVFASSGAPAGEVEPPIHEELPPHPPGGIELLTPAQRSDRRDRHGQVPASRRTRSGARGTRQVRLDRIGRRRSARRNCPFHHAIEICLPKRIVASLILLALQGLSVRFFAS